MSLIQKDCTMYEDKHITTITTLSKLCKIKSKILTDDADISHIYPILEVDSEDEDITNELK